MESQRQRQFPAGQLRWLSASSAIELAQIIYDGYQAIDLAAALGTGLTTRYVSADGQPFQEYCQLLPVPVDEWFPDLPADWTPKEGYFGREREFFHVSDHSAIPPGKMTPLQIMAWLRKESHRLRLNKDRTKFLFEDPVQLIRLGYRVLRVAGRWYWQESTPFAVGLALVGLGAAGVFTSRRCLDCFRQSLPGLSRCRLHSQSEVANDGAANSRATRFSQSRLSKKVMVQLNWRETLPAELKAPRARSRVIAGILWDINGTDRVEWIKRVTTALGQAPNVRQLVPSGFVNLPSRQQLTLLRATIDENEWVSAAWPTKIAAAEAWLVTERQVAPGRKTGLNDQNVQRLMQAETWLAQGLTHKSIAQQLGVSKSHLSHLFARGRAGK